MSEKKRGFPFALSPARPAPLARPSSSATASTSSSSLQIKKDEEITRSSKKVAINIEHVDNINQNISKDTLPIAIAIEAPPIVCASLEPSTDADGKFAGKNAKVVVIPGNLDSKSVLFIATHSITRYISGFCKVTLLKGSANINGYALTAGKTINVASPCWLPAARIHMSSKTQKKDSKDSKVDANGVFAGLRRLGKQALFPSLLSLTAEDATISTSILNSCTCAILMEGIAPEEQQWMVAAEDLSAYRVAPSAAVNAHNAPIMGINATVGECVEVLPDQGGYICVDTGSVGDQHALAQRNISVQYLPLSWHSAVDGILSDMRSDTNLSPRLLLCGAKGVGKSTCLRYTINRLLSEARAVCVLDCDVGQPEYGVPGMISLTIVTTPNLSPPHLHLQSPELAYFIGDITTKSAPARMMASTELLIHRFREIQRAFASGDLSCIGIKPDVSIAASAQTNPFEVLAEDKPTSFYALPLVVNTDGNIRYMGSEILTTIVQAVQPDYVLQLISEKDKVLPALDSIDISRIRGLESGSTVASTHSALDLRTLRLVSYFLGSSSTLNQIVSKSNLASSDTYLGDNFFAANADISRNLYIRNGSLVDKHSTISTCFCELLPWVAPSAAISLGSLSDDLPSELLPAAVNASIVGLCRSEVSEELNLQPRQTNRASSQNVFRTQLELRGALGHIALTPCVGLGVVRSIDLLRGEVHVLTPVDLACSLPPLGNIGLHTGVHHAIQTALIRGFMAIPSTMLFSPALPCHAYLTHDSAGDGTAHTKARNNVKRRSYQNEGT